MDSLEKRVKDLETETERQAKVDESLAKADESLA